MADTKQYELPQLDDACKELLNEVQQHFHVVFEKWDNNICAFQVKQRDDSKIAVDSCIYFFKGFRQADIFHELLHAKCEYVYGSDKWLLYNSTDSLIKRLVMDYKYWQSLSNQIMHLIMYPEYIKKGYKPEEFFADKAVVKSKEFRKFCEKGLKDKGKKEYNPVQLKCYINVLQHLLFFPCGKNFNKDLYDAIDGLKIDPANAPMVKIAKKRYRDEMSTWFENNIVRIPFEQERLIMDNLITD